MKKFRWILLSGLLAAAPQIAQAQPAGGPGSDPTAGQGAPGGAADAGAITNIPAGAATTTTTTTTGIAPDASFVPADDAAFGQAPSSSMPNTGGEPLIVVLAGLSIAGAAVAMRRKVSA